ncbi:hypothetical protein TrLO_g4091 [Triparma laevis f. longispina]|uniref:Cryptochrome DASH n=2 Tax=Triparma laevis TaxID=1534972 RepID=A0A9W7CII8_9STRA|nr:hypothetical protein TrLO_g4091 [Triparma laevis f. longispina]
MSALTASALSTVGKAMTIHLFRFDLRLHDNQALTTSLNNARQTQTPFLPLYIFDPAQLSKQSPSRLKFLLESVSTLRTSLQNNLCIRIGDPVQIISEEFPEAAIFTQLEPCRDERKISQSLDATEIHGTYLYSPSDLPFPLSQMPDVFTPFRSKMEKSKSIDINFTTCNLDNVVILECDKGKIPELSELTSQPLPTFDSRSVLNFTGGEDKALERVNDYIFKQDNLKNYFNTRNGLIGATYSTKLSPWLALGCLSPRYVAKMVKKYEQERVENKSTYWLIFELLVRDFCRLFALKHGDKIFLLDGILGRRAHGGHQNSVKWSLDTGYANSKADSWKEGRTGYPFVDANMRELKATGFMSNRGRQNVASFLALDLNQDWRFGAEHFEEYLLDYDIYSNYVSWCMAAGMTGGRVNKFNVIKQAKDYDPEGEYVKLWCPELSSVPKEYIFEPWKMSKEKQQEYNCVVGRDYPERVVEMKVFKPRTDKPKKEKKMKEKYKGGFYKVVG